MSVTYCRSVYSRKERNMHQLLKVEHKRKSLCVGRADPTQTVTHRMEVRTPNIGRPLCELSVQEFQNVFMVRVYWKGKERLFASDLYHPVVGWLGKKWHQLIEERNEEYLREEGYIEQEEHYDYWH